MNRKEFNLGQMKSNFRNNNGKLERMRWKYYFIKVNTLISRKQKLIRQRNL